MQCVANGTISCKLLCRCMQDNNKHVYAPYLIIEIHPTTSYGYENLTQGPLKAWKHTRKVKFLITQLLYAPFVQQCQRISSYLIY